MTRRLNISKVVAEALAERSPVVALETAVLTHGLPRPVNLEVFREMEAALTEEGVVPAAVAVVGGELCVGLSADIHERLAEGEAVQKAGVADLPALLAQGADAGTTVAAALWAAWSARIRVLVTGGIGGVHRGVETSHDVSGDLAALAQYGGCVVCSGAKVILDLPKTLQALESLGVCVVGYRTNVFPAFVCVDSRLSLRHRADTPRELARVLQARDGLGLSQAVVIANPPPVAQAVSRELVEAVLEKAMKEANQQKIERQDLSPFLLRALASLSGGSTIDANRSLLVANARLGAKVARALTGAPPDAKCSNGEHPER